MIYKIVIPCRMPNLNDFLSAHHIGYKWQQKGKAMILSASKGSEMKREWQRKCELPIRNVLKGRKLSTPIDIHYHYFEINKLRDCDNVHAFCAKVFHDALMSTNSIPNDGWGEISSVTMEFSVDQKHPRVEITIKEVESAG